MQVTYSLTHKDMTAYDGFLIRRAPFLIAFLLSGLVLMVTVLFCSVGRYDQVLVGLFLFAGTWLWLYPKMKKQHCAPRRIDPSGGFQEQRLAIDSEEARLANVGGDWRYPWQQIERVACDSRYVLIMLDKDEALIVPKCAFSCADEAQAFLALARVYCDEGHAGRQPGQAWPPAPSVGDPGAVGRQAGD